jgi:xanthine dehydrogenase accessory factor
VEDVLEAALEAARAGQTAALCTIVRTAGSTPRKHATKMLVRADGSIVGTIGGGRLEKEVVDATLALLARAEHEPRVERFHLTHDLAMCCGGEVEVLIEPLPRPRTLVVCGGGHVGKALAPLARTVGFRVVMVDEVPEFASPERFPEAERILDSFDVRDWKGLPLDGHTFVVIATRDHAVDQAILEALLPHDLAYLGVIGSQGKVGRFAKRIEAKGFDMARFARVRAPIGLDIGAQTPEEIAVSVVAELIAVRAGHAKADALSLSAQRPASVGKPV